KAGVKPKSITRASSAYDATEKGAVFNIIINTLRFDAFLNFLASRNISASRLDTSYKEALRTAIRLEKNEKAKISREEHEKLFAIFESFISALKENEKGIVLTYIDNKSKEAGLY